MSSLIMAAAQIVLDCVGANPDACKVHELEKKAGRGAFPFGAYKWGHQHKVGSILTWGENGRVRDGNRVFARNVL